MKYKLRSKKINNTKISCPKHGLQKTYDLFKDDKIDYKKSGLGCVKCFSDYPVVKNI